MNKSTVAAGVPFSRLKAILALRSSFSELDSQPEIIDAALSLAVQHLKAQIAAVYLYDQRGLLERVAVVGTDNEGQELDNDSLPLEKYLPEQGIICRAVRASKDNTFGEPQWSGEFAEAKDLSQETWQRFQEVIGPIQSCVAVPLNGTNRSFGVLEILNLNVHDDGNAEVEVAEGYWLSVIANELAWALAKCRHDNRTKLLHELAKGVVAAVSESSDDDSLFQAVSDAIVEPPMSHSVCHIRLLVEKHLETIAISASPSSGVTLSGRNVDRVPVSSSLPARTLQDGTHLYIPDITELDPEVENLRNWQWARENDLRAYCCFPLRFGDDLVGTLSLYFGYKHQLSENEVEYLNTVAYFLAACSLVRSTLRGFREILDEDAADLSAAIFDGVGTPRRHDTLASLREIQRELLKVRGKNLGTDAGEKQWDLVRTLVDQERSQLKAELDRAAPESVSINEMIQAVVQQRRRIPFKPYIDFDLELDGTIPIIVTRSQALRFVLKDLLTNAIKSIQRKNEGYGVITLTTGVTVLQNKEYLQILVEDTGEGIPKDQWESIFEWGISYTGGTGVGLFLARQVIAMERGDLNILTSRVGEGTKFRVLLRK